MMSDNDPTRFLDSKDPDGGQLRRGQQCLIVSNCFGAICVGAVGGAFATLVALKMGASPLYVGGLNAIHLGSVFLQLLTLQQVQRRGKRFVILLYYGASAALMAPLVFLPEVWGLWGEGAPRRALVFFMIVLSARHAAIGLGMTGWMPLIQDNVPENVRGRFLGRLRTWTQGMFLLWVVAMALFVGSDAPWPVIRVIFAVGWVASILRIVCFLPIKEFPPPASVTPVARMIREPFRDRRFRWALLYIASFSLAVGLALPFFVVHLKNLGHGDWVVLLGPGAMYLGGILTLNRWGKLADDVGNRAIFSISHVGLIVCLAGWLLVDKGAFGLTIAIILFALIGILNGGNRIAQTRYALSIVGAEGQAPSLTMVAIFGILTQGLAGLLGGAFLRWGADLRASSGALDLNAYHILFIASAILLCVPHAIRRKLRKGDEIPTAQVVMFITRPLRLMMGGIAAVVRGNREMEGNEHNHRE